MSRLGRSILAALGQGERENPALPTQAQPVNLLGLNLRKLDQFTRYHATVGAAAGFDVGKLWPHGRDVRHNGAILVSLHVSTTIGGNNWLHVALVEAGRIPDDNHIVAAPNLLTFDTAAPVIGTGQTAFQRHSSVLFIPYAGAGVAPGIVDVNPYTYIPPGKILVFEASGAAQGRDAWFSGSIIAL